MRLGILLGLAPAAALGIGRFAYALVLPGMQIAFNLSYAQAGLLGSSNTAGYLLGALISHRVLYWSGYRRGLFASLWLQALSLALLAIVPSFPLLMLLRFLQGILGAFVFVGGAALLLASGGKSVASGLYFGGVGIGIVLSPSILPFMKSWQMGWLLLAGLAVFLTLLAYSCYPELKEPSPRSKTADGNLKSIRLILIAYGLYGAGYIGYMTFVTTALNTSLLAFWTVLGCGAALTGLVWGPLVARIGGEKGVIVVLACLAGSSLYWLVIHLPWVSAFFFGLSFLGVITAITDIFRQLLPPSGWARAMGLSTAAFAAGQAIGPSLSGLAADLTGGPSGAIGSATVLLSLGLLLSIYVVIRKK
ncbi:MAG: YbfB/YjiJ family MFS transporter [Trueperaceae bacterium]|nr:YbfB/YjiJ family MFS transporter [Trueperaceae bacterium]